MRRFILLFSLFLICMAAVSCESDARIPVRQVTEFGQKTADIKEPLWLKLDCENCRLEIYRWSGQGVKFEYTACVTGSYTDTKLEGKLKRFRYNLKPGKDGVCFKSRYTGGDRTEGTLSLRVYIPEKTGQIEITCKQGAVKTFDDMKGELHIRADILDVELNRFEGKLLCSLKEGNVRMLAGRLTDGTAVETGMGNIQVKAEYQVPGTFCFYAPSGSLDMQMPKYLRAVFTDDFPIEYAAGETSDAEYASIGYDEEISGRNSATFKLKSGIDRISINRF